jgi:hypothetical protein
VINRFQAEGLGRREDDSAPHAAPGNPFYRALALYLPWSILVCFLPPALALIRRLLPGALLPGALAPAVYLPALLVSAAVTVYLELLDPRTSHNGAHIRGAVLAAAAAYLFASLLSLRPPFNLPNLARPFLPALGNCAAVLGALYIWVFVIYLRDLFRAREIFESYLRRHRGEELRRVMLEDSTVMMGAEERIRSMIRHYSIQLGIVFVLAILCGFLRAPLHPAQYGLTMLIMAAAAMVFSLLNLFRQEQFFAGEGIAVPAAERRKRLGAGILFCAAAALLAALCASDNNILPISIIAALFAAFARFLGRLYRPAAEPIEMPRQNLSTGFDPQTMARLLGARETEPWPFWDYLPYIALALIVTAFLWFMVKPLFGFRSRSGKIPLGLKALRVIRGGLASIRRALRDFFGSLGKGPARRIGGAPADLRGVTEDLLTGWARARKRELRQSLGLFARLILWGGREHQVSWKPSMGPGEFCALLAGAVNQAALKADHEGGSGGGALAGSASGGREDPAAAPQPPGGTPAALPQGLSTAAAILRCGAIFEEALYGPQALGRETRREFQRLVEEITG